MFGSDLLYSALNVSAITDLLDSYESGKALFGDYLVPQDFTGSKSINFYMINAYDASLDYKNYGYSINCRANDLDTSRSLAIAVIDEINRSNYTDCYMVCTVLSTIPPTDDTDNYNTPVEVTIKQQ